MERERDFVAGREKILLESCTERDDLLYQKLSSVFGTASSDQEVELKLLAVCCEYSPEDLSHTAQSCSFVQRLQIYRAISSFRHRMDFLISAEVTTKKSILYSLEDGELAEILGELPIDEALSLIELLPHTRDRKVLGLLPCTKAEAISSQRRYSSGTAGRFMSQDFFAFRPEMTIGDASTFIREHPDIDLLRRVFISDEQGELQGFVPSRALLIHPMHFSLQQVMRDVVQVVQPEELLDEVFEIFERYKNIDLPVVDERKHLIGVITYEDVIDLIEDKADKTIAHISGTEQNLGAVEPIIVSVLSRAPWLGITLCAGLMNAGNLSRLPEKYRLLLHFVPMINGMSGNVGLQCSTILVRGMAAGLLPHRLTCRVIFREILTGSCAGILFGCMGGLLITSLQWVTRIYGIALGTWELGLIICMGMSGACIFASTLGILFPLVFEKIGVDPAIASGPIVTAINDVTSTAMYFLVAKTMVGLLFGA